MIEGLKELRNFLAKQDGYLTQHLLHILESQLGEPMDKPMLNQPSEALFMVNICYLIIFNLTDKEMILNMFNHT